MCSGLGQDVWSAAQEQITEPLSMGIAHFLLLSVPTPPRYNRRLMHAMRRAPKVTRIRWRRTRPVFMRITT
jgi:hypothetical protein